MRTKRRTSTLLALALVVSLAGAACNGDDDEGASQDEAASETGPEPTEPAPDGPTVEVTAVDYAFEGVPDTLAPGTTLTLDNASEEEVHEIVALRVADGEERPVEDLLALPEEEREEIAEVRGVTVAFPGEPGRFPAPSVTLEQPGRYILACFIPLDADPAEYREAAQAQTEPGPVEVEGGPPHVTRGMVAEVVVA